MNIYSCINAALLTASSYFYQTVRDGLKAMLRALLLFTLLLIGTDVCATHYRGGEMSYRSLGGNTYEITFRIYSDCGHGDSVAIRQDLPIIFAAFGADGSRYLVDSTGQAQYVDLPSYRLYGCHRDLETHCARYAVARSTIFLPPDTAGYTIFNSRCCLGDHIANVRNPIATGISLFCRIAGSNISSNSSPSFRTLPPASLCAESEFSLDFSAFDPDGDSLVYELVPALNGGSSGDAKPIPSSNFVPLVTYKSPYAGESPLGKDGSIRLDAATGYLRGICNKSGEYLVSVACREYRQGVFIGTVVRSCVLDFSDCERPTIAAIAADSAAILSSLDSVLLIRCAGNRTISFANRSTGATGYHWDFGVPGRDDDTSSLPNPTFTYPSAGKYGVTLVAFGATCSDTLKGVVQLSDDDMAADFTYSGGPCLLDTVNLLDASTGSAAIVRHFWKAGRTDATGSAAQFVLDDTGMVPITHGVVSTNGCVALATKFINVRGAAIYGGFDTVVPTGLPLTLVGRGGLSYNWEAVPPATILNYIPGSWEAQVPTTVPNPLLIYVLTGRDANGCGGRDTVRVVVSDKSYYFVPTAFTPNGDGHNDILTPYVSGGNILLFNIYNRPGNLVYSSADPHAGWDGRYKDQQAPIGTYYWMLKVRSGYSGSELVFSGDVILLR